MNCIERSDGFGVEEISAQGLIDLQRIDAGTYHLKVNDGDGCHHFEITAQSGRVCCVKFLRTEKKGT